MCKSGADAQTCAAQQRAPPHRLTRSQKTRISADILVLRSAALPFSAVSRALARNTPSLSHQNGQLPCMTLHTDDRAMRIPFFWPKSNQ